MKKLNRCISWVLLLSMMFSMLGAGVYAEDVVPTPGTETSETVVSAEPSVPMADNSAEQTTEEKVEEPTATAPESAEESDVAPDVSAAPELEESEPSDSQNHTAASGIPGIVDSEAVESDEDLAAIDEEDELQATKRYYHIDVLTQGTYTYNFSYSGQFVSTADVNITKVWNDSDDNDGIRPDSVQVYIYQNDSSTPYRTVTLTQSGGWKYSLNNVPAVDSNGKAITYTAKEAAVDGYSSKVEIETVVDDSASGDYAVYEKNGYTIKFGFGDAAPYVSINGSSSLVFSGNTATVSGGVWTYDPTTATYSYEGSETMEVSSLNYVTYTDYQGTTKTLAGSLYSSQWDSGHKNQEFFLSSTYRQSLYLTPDSTITVNYTYSYEYVDEFGHTHTFNNITTAQTFDNPETDNVCSKKNYTDSQAGYDVRLTNTHQTSDTFIENEGTEYNVTVTNTHEVETVDVTAVKKWEHKSNEEANYPTKVVFHISNNNGHMGVAYKKTVTAADGWKAEWTGLPKYVNGVLQKYVVWEEEITDYTGSYSSTTDNDGNVTYTITNTYDPEYTTVSVRKHWDDNNDQDGKRPESVTMTLQQSTDGGEAWTDVSGESATLTAENSWAYVWSELPTKTADEKSISYRVVEKNEDVPEGYVVSEIKEDADVAGLWHITNKHVPETTDITVNKVWVNAYANFLPDSVTVELYADGEPTGKTAVIKESDEWTHTFEDLDVYQNGKKIEYTVKETPVSGFDSVVSDIEDGVITVTNTLKTVSITAKKVWLDGEGNEMQWPEGVTELTFYLHANGQNLYDYYKNSDPERAEEYVQTLSKNQWGFGVNSVTWSGLAAEYGGAPVTYTVWEATVQDYSVDYSLVSQDAAGNRVVKITNQYDPEHTEIAVTKIWNDAYDQDGVRPEVLTVMLYANGEEVRKAYLAQTAGSYTVDNEFVTVTTGSWTHIWTELPIRDDSGNSITYTVGEVDIEGYDSENVGYEFDATEAQWYITNTRIPETVEIKVNKEWETFGNELTLPDVEISLLADGVVVQTVTVGESDNWTYTFKDLPKYKIVDGVGGNKIEYKIVETPVVGYDAPDYSVSTDDGGNTTVTVTNTLDTVYLNVRKIWADENNYDGIRPSEVTVKLLADGSVVESVEISAVHNWWYTFDDLPKYNADGSIIVYSVEEVPVEGYEAPVYGYNTAGTYVAITNAHEPLKTEVTVTKAWDDLEDQDQARPETLTVQLYRDGEAYGDSVELSEDNGWTYTFSELDRYDGYGELFVYEVREADVENYELDSYVVTHNADYSAYKVTMTNTYVPPVEISVVKNWEDEDNQDKSRPDYITVNLYAGEDKIDSKTVSAADGWECVFTNLYKYDEYGNEIEYSVTENEVDNYFGWVEGSAEDGFVITNFYEAPVEITVTKVWDDDDNRDGIRPESITVILLADGEPYSEMEITEEDDWTLTISGLYKLNKDGEEVKYTISEKSVDGYSCEIVGNGTSNVTITNKHTPETMDITVDKVWKDNDNKEGKRPESITVQLYANGKKYGDAVTIKADADGNWSCVFEDLPVNEKGKAITYTVKEAGVKYYVAKYSDLEDGTITIKNTFVDIPLTGDTMNMIFWSLMVIGAGAALGVVGTMSFRKRRYGR